MTDHQPISCQLHDYIEIACLYRIRINLTMTDNTRVTGQALTTRTAADKREYLVIRSATGEQQIELKHIKRMQALTPNPHFESVDF